MLVSKFLVPRALHATGLRLSEPADVQGHTTRHCAGPEAAQQDTELLERVGCGCSCLHVQNSGMEPHAAHEPCWDPHTASEHLHVAEHVTQCQVYNSGTRHGMAQCTSPV